MHWPFRKYWFTELCQPSKCRHTELSNGKTLYIKITTDLIIKFFKY